MKTALLLLSLALPLGFSGCGSVSPSRMITGTLAAAGGAATGAVLGSGNPITTAAGAGAGVLLSETLHAVNEHSRDEAMAEGYEKGRSDGAKQRYAQLVDAQRESNRANDAHFNMYEIPLPARQEDGAWLTSGTVTLRIAE